MKRQPDGRWRSPRQAAVVSEAVLRAVLIIADEAPGIESGIWDAVAGTMAGGTVHIVMAGNPTTASGAFFDAFARERGLWNCFTVSAFDSPNLAGLSLQQLLRMDPRDGGPLDDNPFPYLVTKRWVYDQYQSWWHGDDSSSPNWLSRVLAEFPQQAQNALIKLMWLERARERAQQNPFGDSDPVPLVTGVDVGGGLAETVVFISATRPGRHRIIAMGAWRGEDTRGEVVRFLQPYRSRLSAVRVDAIGIGHNFAQHLRDQGFPVEFINVGMPCPSRPELGENDPNKRFVNLKALYYQTLADIFERNEIEGLSDEVTIGQLAELTYEIDSHGRVKIESKERARERGLRSPDRAEALMLALGKPLERTMPLYMMPVLVLARHREAMTPEQIAIHYQVTTAEVRQWLEQATTAAAANNPFGKTCAYCDKLIGPNTSQVRERSL